MRGRPPLGLSGASASTNDSGSHSSRFSSIYVPKGHPGSSKPPHAQYGDGRSPGRSPPGRSPPGRSPPGRSPAAPGSSPLGGERWQPQCQTPEPTTPMTRPPTPPPTAATERTLSFFRLPWALPGVGRPAFQRRSQQGASPQPQRGASPQRASPQQRASYAAVVASPPRADPGGALGGGGWPPQLPPQVPPQLPPQLPPGPSSSNAPMEAPRDGAGGAGGSPHWSGGAPDDASQAATAPSTRPLAHRHAESKGGSIPRTSQWTR